MIYFVKRPFHLALSLYIYNNHLNVYSLAKKNKIEWQNATTMDIAGTGRMSITKASASLHLLAQGKLFFQWDNLEIN